MKNLFTYIFLSPDNEGEKTEKPPRGVLSFAIFLWVFTIAIPQNAFVDLTFLYVVTLIINSLISLFIPFIFLFRYFPRAVESKNDITGTLGPLSLSASFYLIKLVLWSHPSLAKASMIIAYVFLVAFFILFFATVALRYQQYKELVNKKSL